MAEKIKNQSTYFSYIETLLRWGDGVNTTDLKTAFGMNKKTAQKVITAYYEAYESNITYDCSKRRHVKKVEFKSKNNAIMDSLKFLNYLRGKHLCDLYYDNEVGEWSDVSVKDFNRLIIPTLNYEIIHPVIVALRHRYTLAIKYLAKDPKDTLTIRTISPNRLVFAKNRYHIHAYCHSKECHLDFVLSRILHAKILNRYEYVGIEKSKEWNTRVKLTLEPAPTLDQKSRDALLIHFPQVVDGKLIIECSKTEAFYVKSELGVKDDNTGRWVLLEEKIII